MYDEQVQHCLLKQLESAPSTLDINPKEAATCLASRAETMSLDLNNFSPFAKEAQLANQPHTTGGKPDDITVLVAQYKGFPTLNENKIL